MTKCRSKVKEPCSSSIASANAMPTSVINSRVVLIVCFICHDKKVYEEIIFCKASQYKSQLHFPSQNNRTCTKLTNKQQSTLIKWDFSLSLAFSFILIYVNKSDVSASRNSSRNAAIHEKKNILGVSLNFWLLLRVDFTTSEEGVKTDRLKFRLKRSQIKSNNYIRLF